MTTPHRRFVLILDDIAGADDTPAEVRLRHILKSLLRVWCLRCVECVEKVPEDEPRKESVNDDTGSIREGGQADA